MSSLTDPEIEELNARTIFVRDAMPAEWLNYAEELLESAEILWTQQEKGLRAEAIGTGDGLQPGIHVLQQTRRVSSISRSYILLAGFALENMIKGLLVAQDPSLITGGKLSRDLKSHSLLGLVAKVKGLSLSEDEKQVCQVVQDAIPYWGRYPIPLEYNGVLPEVAVDDEFRSVVLALHFRLGKRLHGLIRNGWDSGVGPRSINSTFAPLKLTLQTADQ
jgi:hypothetical protein